MKYLKLFSNITFITLALLVIITGCTNKSAVRNIEKFNCNWKFSLSDSTIYRLNNFDDSQWRVLNLPHDWSIEGSFSSSAPAGTGGGALPGGIGWYRKYFTVKAADSVKNFYITFDGVYQNSEVYINGNLLGNRPNGYITFSYNLTPYLNFDGSNNVIAVRVNNGDQPNSRWYSGSGIYRNVWLTKTSKIHMAQWGTFITTPVVDSSNASVSIEISVDNTTASKQNILVESRLFDQKNKQIGITSSQINASAQAITKTTHKINVTNPVLWSDKNPYLYKAINYVKQNNKVIDVYETTFGIRYFEFNADKGFLLNGEPVKINGVCMHHDLGALGAAVNYRATQRQLEILKAMGCNGIRTSHNPPSPELLQLCNKMGFIVQNETFDMWQMKKSENDYAKYFDQWYQRDLTDHLLRDRNNPCIFSWSIGNEILEQWQPQGANIAIELAAIVKKYIPGMPVTSGCNDPEPHNNIIKSGALDLVGFNYHHESFEMFKQKFPGQKFIATESVSSLNSRGVYNMPSDSVRRWPEAWDKPFYDGNPDNSCSGYDNCSAPWGSTHIETWSIIKRNPYLSGQYIWTGFDYLGEPTPYGWPSRSSYFGIIDLAGFPKDIYYFYKSEWTNNDVLHLFPHWNWDEGQNIDMWVYTNCASVELFVNGNSCGVQQKNDTIFRLKWPVTFAKGEVKAVGVTKNGKTIEQTIKTAAEPYKIILSADRTSIYANQTDLSFVTATVVDKFGTVVPYANNLISFSTDANASVVAVDNGSQTSHEPFKASQRKAFNGKCLAIIAGNGGKGCKVIATSPGLVEGVVELSFK